MMAIVVPMMVEVRWRERGGYMLWARRRRTGGEREKEGRKIRLGVALGC